MVEFTIVYFFLQFFIKFHKQPIGDFLIIFLDWFLPPRFIANLFLIQFSLLEFLTDFFDFQMILLELSRYLKRIYLAH